MHPVLSMLMASMYTNCCQQTTSVAGFSDSCGQARLYPFLQARGRRSNHHHDQSLVHGGGLDRCMSRRYYQDPHFHGGRVHVPPLRSHRCGRYSWTHRARAKASSVVYAVILVLNRHSCCYLCALILHPLCQEKTVHTNSNHKYHMQ